MEHSVNLEEPRALAERFFEALAKRDFSAYWRCLSTERRRARGREWLRGRFAKFSKLQVQKWQILEVMPQDLETVWVKYAITYRAGAKQGEDELEMTREGPNWKIERSDFC